MGLIFHGLLIVFFCGVRLSILFYQTLASLASRRSNCMKRRVGAIIVRENRVLASGYNGTPRGLKNCNEGGCDHCNGTQGKTTECVCLHAEENALLEAGRERVGKDAVLYCNTYVSFQPKTVRC